VKSASSPSYHRFVDHLVDRRTPISLRTRLDGFDHSPNSPEGVLSSGRLAIGSARAILSCIVVRAIGIKVTQMK
jgi:hypothetical protein